MRVAVTGRNGQVATALLERAERHPGIEVHALGRPQLDLQNIESIHSALKAVRPGLIINAAAYTAVDKAEQEQEAAFAVNRDGAGAVAAAANRLGVPVVQISTDYVYPGDKATPYVEGDGTGPLGVYGQSKLEGEEAVRAVHPGALILRTSWVYSPFGSNFVKTMLRIGAMRPELGVVDDQIGNPTAALDIADALLRIAPQLSSGGTFHLCGSGEVTWCGLARHIFEISRRLGGPAPVVKAITTADYPTPARRPVNSRMSMDGFESRFGFRLPDWKQSVADTVSRLLKDA